MTSPPRWLLRQAELDGRLVDCRIEGEQVSAIAAHLSAAPGDRIIDCAGGALLPGLADHHLHLWAAAAARSSLDVEGATDLSGYADQPGTGWLRAVGAGVDLDRAGLDRIWPDRPVRLQHRSGALWTLNSAAIEIIGSGLDEVERRTGQLWRADRRLRELLVGSSAIVDADLVALGHDLARHGITRVTDATPDLTPESLATLTYSLPQYVLTMSDEIDSNSPVKIVIADHELPGIEQLVDKIGHAHNGGRAVAIHAVSQVALILAVIALETAGTTAGDRIEHAAVCGNELADRLAALEVTVVTQPTLWARHGRTYYRDSPPDERPLLWRHASLIARGVRVVVSSDAPYGDADPWQTIHACARRTSAGGVDEAVAAADVLRSMLLDPVELAGEPRRIIVGSTTDLVLLDAPLAVALQKAERSGDSPVRATFLNGQAYPPIAHRDS